MSAMEASTNLTISSANYLRCFHPNFTLFSNMFYSTYMTKCYITNYMKKQLYAIYPREQVWTHLNNSLLLQFILVKNRIDKKHG